MLAYCNCFLGFELLSFFDHTLFLLRSYLLSQGWPWINVSPIQELLALFAAERQLKREISHQEMLDGTLGALLIDNDFTEPSNVSGSLLLNVGTSYGTLVPQWLKNRLSNTLPQVFFMHHNAFLPLTVH